MKTPTLFVPRPIFLLADDTDVPSVSGLPEIILALLKLLEQEAVFL